MVQRLVFYSHPSHINDRIKYSSFEATQAMDFYCTPFSRWFTLLSHVATCVIKAVSEPKNMINQDSDGDLIMVMVMTKMMNIFLPPHRAFHLCVRIPGRRIQLDLHRESGRKFQLAVACDPGPLTSVTTGRISCFSPQMAISISYEIWVYNDTPNVQTHPMFPG